jgi:hypothetical protein
MFRKKLIDYFIRFIHYNLTIRQYKMLPVLTPPPIRGPIIPPVIAQRRNAIGQVFNLQGGVNLMEAFDAAMASRPVIDMRMGA